MARPQQSGESRGEAIGSIHVIIADDHPVVRRGLALQLAQASDIKVVGETGRGEEILALVQQKMPDVVILDAVMPNVKASKLVRDIKARYPAVKVVVFSAYEDSALVRGLFAAGVDGYMLKEEMLTRVVDAVREVMSGGVPLSSRVAAAMRDMWKGEVASRQPSPGALTPREQEVLQWMAQGLSNRAIAEKLHVTERTVKFHVGNILGKLGAHSRVEAVRIAIERGLVDVY